MTYENKTATTHNSQFVPSSSERVRLAVEAARRAIAARSKPKEESYGAKRIAEQQQIGVASNAIVWNTAQQQAIDTARSGKSFCLIGAAGTGKTTNLKGIIRDFLSSNKLPPLEKGTKHLHQGAPGVVLFSYTRRAVRNIAKQMPEEIKSHCITGHKLLEFAPERFEVDDGKGGIKFSLRFVPTRHRGNPLPSNLRLIIVDESSMVAYDFMQLVLAALPNPSNVQFIFLGDLHQLPPVYGDAILGHKLLELPVVELTEVYRQALESPIIELALQVKDNALSTDYKTVIKDFVKTTSQGTVRIIPWKKKLDSEEGCYALQSYFREWVRTGDRRNNDTGTIDPLDFENDVILCPWNKSFGNIELNKAIGTELALKYDREVFEIIAGYEKIYYAVGDRILYEKRDAIITRIVRNTRYIGKPPQYASRTMDYWGYTKTPTVTVDNRTEADIEAMLDSFGDDVEDRVHEASHAIYLRFADQGTDEDETILSSAAAINSTELAYCMSVHKSQGSEWKRVIFVTHDCHSKMLSREMAYTAITRASKELYIFMAPMMLVKAAQRPRIKGNTLAEKLKWFEQKKKELIAQRNLKLSKKDEDDEDD